jgi:hypothetical protein
MWIWFILCEKMWLLLILLCRTAAPAGHARPCHQFFISLWYSATTEVVVKYINVPNIGNQSQSFWPSILATVLIPYNMSIDNSSRRLWKLKVDIIVYKRPCLQLGPGSKHFGRTHVPVTVVVIVKVSLVDMYEPSMVQALKDWRCEHPALAFCAHVIQA